MIFNQSSSKERGLPGTLQLIRKIAEEKFQWVPTNDGNVFFIDEHPYRENLDSIIDLQAAIELSISKADVVLTTPLQRKFFKHTGAKIKVFDISPAQLITVTDAQTYWCDIFNQQALLSLLQQANPTAIYLSNIPERTWGDIEPINSLASTLHSFNLLKTVIVSGIMDQGQLSKVFINRLESFGWQSTIFKNKTAPHAKRIFVTTRKT